MESARGEQVKTMMRWRWDLFWRCLRASCEETLEVDGDVGAGVRKSAYRCDHDAGIEMALAANLGSVQTIQNLSWVGGEGGEDFRT